CMPIPAGSAPAPTGSPSRPSWARCSASGSPDPTGSTPRTPRCSRAGAWYRASTPRPCPWRRMRCSDPDRLDGMISTPWESASGLYKVLVIASMAVSALGIILALVGANTTNRPLMYTAVGIILVGLLTHVAGLVVRGRDVKTYRKQNPPVPKQRP